MRAKSVTFEIKTDRETRLDLALTAFLQTRYARVSRNRVKQLFQDQRVTWQTGHLAKGSEILKVGSNLIEIADWDEIEFSVPTAMAAKTGCFLPILYEDDEILALYKQSGVPSIPLSADESETAVGAALAHFPGLKMVGKGELEPGILHRLDTETSGVIIFAKTNEAYTFLKKAWHSKVVKVYKAIVRQASLEVKPLPNLIRDPIGHDLKSKKKMVIAKKPTKWRGKPQPAITRIINTKPLNKDVFELTIQIETGVMHQIRCHLAAYGWPIIGDKIYGTGKTDRAKRLLLHASEIQLPTKSGKVLKISSDTSELEYQI